MHPALISLAQLLQSAGVSCEYPAHQRNYGSFIVGGNEDEIRIQIADSQGSAIWRLTGTKLARPSVEHTHYAHHNVDITDPRFYEILIGLLLLDGTFVLAQVKSVLDQLALITGDSATGPQLDCSDGTITVS